MKKIILFILIIIVIWACSSAKRISDQNISAQYDPQNINTLYTKAFNTNDSLTMLFFGIPENILPKDELPSALNFKITYQIFRSYSFKETISSDTLDMIIDDPVEGGILGKLNIITPDTGKYVIKLKVLNKKIHRNITKYLTLDKSSKFNSQNFICMDSSGYPYLKNFFNKNQYFRIQYRNKLNSDLFVYYYNRKFPIALPPFITSNHKPFNYKPDSIYKIKIREGQTDFINLPKEGFYHFVIDTSSRKGLTLFRFYENYPEVSTVHQMLFPLRYISTKHEFKEIIESADKKQAIDEFWLKQASDINRAKQILRSYYRQVERANVLFTSYTEGWKTDRGIIYIILGAPKTVYREDNDELWIYGEANQQSSLTFRFLKVKNPFTDNDYRLIRSSRYKDSWYFAVDNWRR